MKVHGEDTGHGLPACGAIFELLFSYRIWKTNKKPFWFKSKNAKIKNEPGIKSILL